MPATVEQMTSAVLSYKAGKVTPFREMVGKLNRFEIIELMIVMGEHTDWGAKECGRKIMVNLYNK